MPPNYPEGFHWTLLRLRVLLGPEEDVGRRKCLRVEVVKKSLKVDGRWGREVPFVIEHKWEDWLDLREQLSQASLILAFVSQWSPLNASTA